MLARHRKTLKQSPINRNESNNYLQTKLAFFYHLRWYLEVMLKSFLYHWPLRASFRDRVHLELSIIITNYTRTVPFFEKWTRQTCRVHKGLHKLALLNIILETGLIDLLSSRPIQRAHMRPKMPIPSARLTVWRVWRLTRVPPQLIFILYIFIHLLLTMLYSNIFIAI